MRGRPKKYDRSRCRAERQARSGSNNVVRIRGQHFLLTTFHLLESVVPNISQVPGTTEWRAKPIECGPTRLGETKTVPARVNSENRAADCARLNNLSREATRHEPAVPEHVAQGVLSIKTDTRGRLKKIPIAQFTVLAYCLGGNMPAFCAP